MCLDNKKIQETLIVFHDFIRLNSQCLIKLKQSIAMVMVTLGCMSAWAQNDFYSHIESAKNFYNPAMPVANPVSFTLLHRNARIYEGLYQFNTMAGVDVPVPYSYRRLKQAQISLFMFDERMSSAGYMRRTGGLLSVGQSVRLAERSVLLVGLQCSFFEHSFGMNQFYTGSQWDPNLGFNPSLPNGEQLVHQKSSLISLATGIWWQKTGADNNPIAYIGVAGFNLNKPYENFTGRSVRIPPRYTLLAGYRVFDNKKVVIIPEITMYSIRYQQFISVGLKAGVYTFENNPFLPFRNGYLFFESRYLNRNAWFGVGLDQPMYSIGLSYEFPLSSMDFKNTTALELHVTLKWQRKKKIQPLPAQDYTIGQVRKFFNEQSSALKSDSVSPERAPEEKNSKPISLALKKDFKFGFNDATLNAEACQYLDELAELLINNTNIHIEIIGHTDDVGTREANRIISYRRAQVVADYLMNKGVSPSRIKIVGKLDTEPLFPNTSPENRAKNRRVEFVLYYF